MRQERWGTPRTGHLRWLPRLVVLLFLFLSLSVAACAGKTTAAPTFAGGTYTSTQFHFRITYPNGWKVNVQPATDAVVPLTVVITRPGATSTTSQALSTFTIMVFDAHNPDIAASVRGLAGDNTLRKITISGQPAYAAAPIQEQLPNAQGTVTHTDYYLPTSQYEYQLSTDALGGAQDASALAQMLASFTLLP
jgi:hypothetical protein